MNITVASADSGAARAKADTMARTAGLMAEGAEQAGLRSEFEWEWKQWQQAADELRSAAVALERAETILCRLENGLRG
jgi:hypothetical protein